MATEDTEEFIDWSGGSGKSHRKDKTEFRKFVASLRSPAQRQRARDLLERCGVPVADLSKKQLDSLVFELSLIFFKGLMIENIRLELIYSTVAASCVHLDKTDVWFAFDIPLAQQRSDRDFYAECRARMAHRQGIKAQDEEDQEDLVVADINDDVVH